MYWMSLLCCALMAWRASSAADEVIFGYEDPSKNLVANWDFEDDFNPDKSDWFIAGAQYEFDNDSYTGARSVRISNRATLRFAGISQFFKNLKGNTLYYFSAFIKLLDNDDTNMYFYVRLAGSYTNSEGKGQRIFVAKLTSIRASPNWRQIGGDFVTPEPIAKLRFEMEVAARKARFLIDTVSLVEIPWDKDWKRQSDIDIDKYRKNMLTLTMDVPDILPAYCKMKVELKQKKRHFGFGSALKADPFNADNEFARKYREFFVKNFEWAVYENDMKWKPMEAKKGSIKYGRVDRSLNFLDSYNISVRGHSVLWSIKDSNPTWVRGLTGDELKNEVFRRADYVSKHYKDRLIQWDVINEYLHGRFYTLGIGDPLLIDKIHEIVHNNDPNVALYLNDYQLLRTGDYCSGIVDLAKELMSRNVPVHGIGVQAHMRVIPMAPEIIKKRLQMVSQAGLPVVLTELGVHSTNITIRAWQLEVMLRMAFSSPNVAGFVFWEFHDSSTIGFEPEQTALFVGDNFEPNEAGRVFQELMAKWRTSATFVPKKRYMQERVLAFHGLYEAKVYYKDQEIKNFTFYLHPGQDMTFNLDLTPSDVSSVLDGDADSCGILGGIQVDDVDATNPRNKGRGYNRLRSWRKTAKVEMKPYIKAKNTASN